MAERETAMKNNEASYPHCLLCGSSQIAIHDSLRAEDIFKCWAETGHHFSSSVIQPLLDEGTIHLYDCRACGFQFFDPKLAGGAEFYEQLHAASEGYYAARCPENDRNARFAVQKGYRNILDVGCGPGFALDTAKLAGLETYGIELSRTAAAAAAQRGHTIFPVLLENMEPAWEGKFDLISLNHMLEHVPEPVGLIRRCSRLLSPRGVIAIAVPGAEGVLRVTPWLPANWPPHHLTRWRFKDFDTLARLAGLRVLKTGGNRLLGSELETNLLGHRRFCQILQKPYHGLSPRAVKILCFLYRKLGMKHFFPARGHGIYCYLGRSAGSNRQ